MDGKLLRPIAGLSAMLIMAGCASSVPDADNNFALKLPDQQLTTRSEDFRASPFDRIDIKVMDLPDLNGSYMLDIDGRTKIPMVGELNLKDMTALQIASLIEYHLSQTYLQNPDVVVSLEPAYVEQVTIEGAVKSPGMYEVRPGLTLLEAIALGGGASDTSNQRRAIVVRKVDGERQMAAFDLIDIREGKEPDPAVYGNDLIIMDGSQVRSVFLDIVRTGPLLAAFRPIW